MVLKRFNSYKDALKYERFIVNRDFVNSRNTYNVSIGGGSHEHTTDQRSKIKVRMIENNPMKNLETVKKMVANRNYTPTLATRPKLSEKAKIFCNTPTMRHLRSLNASGHNNSSFDKNIYKFRHMDGREFIGYSYDFLKTYNLSRNNFSKFKSDHTRTFYGWRMI